MTGSKKDNLESFRKRSAAWLLLFGCLITSAGFIVDPLGDISDAVLLVFGQCLFYAGAVLGIDVVVSRRIRKQLEEDENNPKPIRE